jgi:myo-inositol-1(or 4)-monophosphatase
MTRTIDELIDFTRIMASDSGAAILPLFRADLEVENKHAEEWDPVTAADRQAEAVMRKLIEAQFPDDAILGEEYGEKPGRSGYKWILDPIDGTRAFVVGVPTWATLIGLYFEDKPLLGAMHQPFIDELFVGDGQQAFYEKAGRRTALHVSNCTRLESAKVGTTSPHLYEKNGFLAGFERLRDGCRLIRYSGDAYFFSMLAAGQLDIALDPSLQTYDIAALIPIIEGAGGYVREWTGRDPSKGGNILAAASTALMEQALDVLSTQASNV